MRKVMDMYSREPLSGERFRKTFLRWKSVRIVAEEEDCKPKAAGFQIKAVRRVIVDKEWPGRLGSHPIDPKKGRLLPLWCPSRLRFRTYLPLPVRRESDRA